MSSSEGPTGRPRSSASAAASPVGAARPVAAAWLWAAPMYFRRVEILDFRDGTLARAALVLGPLGANAGGAGTRRRPTTLRPLRSPLPLRPWPFRGTLLLPVSGSGLCAR